MTTQRSHNTPIFRPSKWEIVEAALQGCSVRGLRAQFVAEAQVVKEEYQLLMHGEDDDQ